MKYSDRYIPKEHLALKINYCRKQLEQLPKVKLHKHFADGAVRTRLSVGNHRFSLGTKNGDDYFRIWVLRDELERQLQVYEAIWDCYFKTSPPEYDIPRIIRTVNTGNNRIILDKDYFDSLKNDANTKYPKPMIYPFNGILYRSAAERDIAIFYTEMDIPFKYEPEVYLAGVSKPLYPDFIVLIRELNTCKFQEHFGIMSSSNYMREIQIKFSNYINAGLIPDHDVFFTYNTEDTPFDVRGLSVKLNSIVFGTMICSTSDQQIDNK